MTALWQDIRYSFRTLKKAPAFTAVAVITLALGIGANAAIFSVVNSILIQPLAYRNSDRIVVLNHFYPKRDLTAGVSVPGYVHYRDSNHVFDHLAAFRLFDANLMGQGEPERLRGVAITSNFFDTFGAAPLLGRSFTSDEAQPGRDQAVVLSYGLWQRRFGGDPKTIGLQITINGNVHTVIGIMPQTFRPGQEFNNEMDIFSPLAFVSDQLTPNRWLNENLEAHGLLKAGVTIEQAQADMDSMTKGLEDRFGGAVPFRLTLRSIQDDIVSDMRAPLFLSMGAVGFLLLLACANVANLRLARGAAREKEIAVRVALGGGQYRIVRQFLTESLVLSLLGGVAGLILAFWAVDALAYLNVGYGQLRIPRAGEIRVDGAVLLFTFAISLVTGLAFGAIPAIRISKSDVQQKLKETGRTSSAASRRFENGLIVAQMAIALVLLAGAGLMLESFRRVQRVNPGFRPANLLVVQLSLPSFKYTDRQHIRAFFDDAIQNIRGIPGVQAAGGVSALPLADYHDSGSFDIEGSPTPPGGEAPHGDKWRVTETYFQTMGIPLVRGRFFSERDTAEAPTAAIIDETLARKYFPNEDPLGKRITFIVGGSQRRTAEIVGVVGHVKHWSLDRENPVQYYLSERQLPLSGMFLVVRATGHPLQSVSAVRNAIRTVDGDLPLFRITTMEDVVADSLVQRRLSTVLLAVFGLIALALASVGLYGVISYTVAQRTREIAIRMAVGAERFSVLRMVAGQAMFLVLVGLLIGLAGAIGLTRLVSSLLFGITATDPLTFVLVSAILIACAMAASLIPARRATLVDPLEALRCE